MARDPGGPLRRLPPGASNGAGRQHWRHARSGAHRSFPASPDLQGDLPRAGLDTKSRSGDRKTAEAWGPKGNPFGAGNRPPSWLRSRLPRTRRTSPVPPAGLVASESGREAMRRLCPLRAAFVEMPVGLAAGCEQRGRLKSQPLYGSCRKWHEHGAGIAGRARRTRIHDRFHSVQPGKRRAFGPVVVFLHRWAWAIRGTRHAHYNAGGARRAARAQLTYVAPRALADLPRR